MIEDLGIPADRNQNCEYYLLPNAPVTDEKAFEYGVLQGLAVGDMVPVANDGTGLRVRAIEAERVLATSTDDGTWAWTWTLEPAGDATRLISRTRMTTVHQPLPARLATRLLLVPASWAMERRMLLGLRDRAEGRFDAAPPPARPVAAAGTVATKIAPDVYLLGPWGRTQTNAYLVRDGSSWVLVDAGWENDGPRIQAAARSSVAPSSPPCVARRAASMSTPLRSMARSTHATGISRSA